MRSLDTDFQTRYQRRPRSSRKSQAQTSRKIVVVCKQSTSQMHLLLRLQCVEGVQSVEDGLGQIFALLLGQQVSKLS